jgi:hypothetical protein
MIQSPTLHDLPYAQPWQIMAGLLPDTGVEFFCVFSLAFAGLFRASFRRLRHLLESCGLDSAYGFRAQSACRLPPALIQQDCYGRALGRSCRVGHWIMLWYQRHCRLGSWNGPCRGVLREDTEQRQCCYHAMPVVYCAVTI